MKDYKRTLNLPETKFPMRANLAKREPEMLARWEHMSLYDRVQKHFAGAERFILHDGPPYANGAIHIGHAVNKVLKDIILKSRRLAGFDCPYVPGWDCHGLPIELEVEKKHGKAGERLSLPTFYRHCRDYAREQIDCQRADFIRLGVLGDWQAPYLTMSPSLEAGTVRALLELWRAGYIDRGFKPVYWCLDCRSALAEAEIEYRDRTSDTVDVFCRAFDPEALSAVFGTDAGEEVVGIPIWTTTPWTLVANRALAVSAELRYQLLRVAIDGKTQRLVLARDLRDSVLQRYGARLLGELGECTGKQLEGLQCSHPLYEHSVPVVIGHHVSAESGTGIVHIAPAHGVDDYMVAEHHGLETHSSVQADGCYDETVAELAGVHINKALEPILNLLKKQDRLLAHTPFQHSYPCCWRHKSGIIFRTTRQWFVRMQHNALLDKARRCVEKAVSFEPQRARARMSSMLAERPDWCISRQRTWGIPMAVFVHKETGDLHPETEQLMMRVADEIEKNGIECWRTLDADSLSVTDADSYEKCTDVVDVWFDSGVTHRVVLDQHAELQRPADVYLEGSDQHRGWFQSSLFTSVAMNGDAPYKTLVSHGFVVDEAGHKMSKSRGNIISPQQVVETMGADVLRLWVASTDYRDEMRISDVALARMSDMYRRMRNTMRFMLANLCDFDASVNRVAQADMLLLDRWIVHRAALLERQLRAAYEQYQFHLLCQKVHHFCAVDLGSFYLDVVKDRQYTMHRDGQARRSGQTALFLLIDNMVRWIAPVLSFTAEEVWLNLPHAREDSVFMTRYTDDLSEFVEEDQRMSDADWELLIQAREAANALIERHRNDQQLGSSLEAELVFYCNGRLHELMRGLDEELRFLMLSSEAHVRDFDEAENVAESKLTGLKIAVKRSAHAKCARCWHRRPEVGDLEPRDLCARCVKNIATEPSGSEQRRFV